MWSRNSVLKCYIGKLQALCSSQFDPTTASIGAVRRYLETAEWGECGTEADFFSYKIALSDNGTQQGIAAWTAFAYASSQRSWAVSKSQLINDTHTFAERSILNRQNIAFYEEYDPQGCDAV
jgi:hypothetical protein